MFWTVIILLLILWILGFLGEVGGGFVHTLLGIALILFVIQVIIRKR
ncbi:lmo0937 family membrane protein [Geomicrobium sp. JCM 19055]|nr:lmo0937 family membrane protein [Geomicrobium sp. JCM 19055]